jgi:carboxyl-terminal processing protease
MTITTPKKQRSRNQLFVAALTVAFSLTTLEAWSQTEDPALAIGAKTAQSAQVIEPETGPAETNGPVSISFDELQLFADTFDAIRRGYVEEVTDAELFEMAVKGMLTSLDPHSAYLTDDRLQQFAGINRGPVHGSRDRNWLPRWLYFHRHPY